MSEEREGGTPAATGGVSAARGRWGIGFVEAFAMMMLVAGATAFAVWNLVDQRLAALADAQFRIAVIDYAPVYEALKAGRSLEEIAPLFEAVRAEGARHAAAGYLVMTTAQIVAAPEAMHVKVDLALPPASVLAPPAGLPLDFGSVVEGLAQGQSPGHGR